MNKREIEREIQIATLERDRNLKLHCPLVAAKFQRKIDKLTLLLDEQNKKGE